MKALFRAALSVTALLSLTVLQPAGAEAATTLKMATLAPEASTWGKFFKRVAADIEKSTGGAVTVKIYYGGSQGDEKVVVEKMRTGQLHIAAITAVGIASIAPETLVLQAPGLITDYKTLDKVRGALKSRFDKTMSDKGFTNLGWGDVGLAYYYSNIAVRKPEDLKSSELKVWAWNADPIAREVTDVIGITPIPTGVPEVLSSLNTGHINTFYTSPLACLQLKWCNYVKVRVTKPLAVGIGAVVMSTTALDGLGEHKQKVVDAFTKWTDALTRKVRDDNKKATKILAKKRNIEDIELSADEAREWDAVAKKVQDRLVGKVYPKELLDKVRGLAGK